MRDFVITAGQIKRELRFFGICFLAALAINIFAISFFRTSWLEILTTLHVTVLIAFAFYSLLSFVRIMKYGATRLLHHERSKRPPSA